MTQETMTKEIKELVLNEYKNGNIVVAGIEGLQTMPIKEFIKQDAEFMLYDLNRSEAVVLTFINDPKWVNDYAVCKVIRELKQQLSAERERGQQFPTTDQMDAAIDVSIVKMFGGLEAASIDHFLQTGKINGSFRQRLHDCIKSASMLVDIKAKTQLLKERERAGKLIGALNEYIVLLGEELDEVMGFVNAHQWKSTRFEKGEELRQKIKQTLNEYEKEITGNKDHTNPSS